MNQSQIICSNAGFDAEMRAWLELETPNYQWQWDANDCSDCDIAFGQPDPQQTMNSSRLRWLHVTSAGYSRYETPEFIAALKRNQQIFTNSSHVYDDPCAQHLLAMMLSFSRQLPWFQRRQNQHQWGSKTARAHCDILQNHTVLLLGYGAIARRLSELLQPFGSTIIAFRRRANQDDSEIEIVGEADLNATLARADHVVNTLPLNEATEGLMDEARFEAMKAGAYFYNIGRGRTVAQNALIRALQSEHLGAAYLDVTDPEPLPADNPLWDAPNCFITPHCGGAHRNEDRRLAQHFLANLRLFETGDTLQDRALES